MAVYNTMDYLPQCLDSLCRQTLGSFEVFCVDDASTDGSSVLLDEYATRDSRFNVIHLDRNQGQAHARNVALKLCTAPYVCFLDSDDWLEPDALQQVTDTFEANPQTDCVVMRVVCYDNDTHAEKELARPSFKAVSGRQAFIWSIDWTLHGVYAVRTELHKAHPYDESCRAYSDDNTTRIHYLLAREVRSSNATYYYRQRKLSVTHDISPRRFDYLRATVSMQRSLRELHISDPLVWRLFERQRWLTLIDTCRFVYLHGHQLPKTELNKGLMLMHTIWKNTNTRLLPGRLKAKFGYMPLRPSWKLFCWQERAYFFLKSILRKGMDV